jgi:DNA-binding PadR family transcriptional regulator
MRLEYRTFPRLKIPGSIRKGILTVHFAGLAVAEQTESRMRLGPGTLYSSIQTLLEAKLIEELDQRESAKLGQERRRYYRLTPGGRKLARSEAERLADLLRVARARKILRGDYV